MVNTEPVVNIDIIGYFNYIGSVILKWGTSIILSMASIVILLVIYIMYLAKPGDALAKAIKDRFTTPRYERKIPRDRRRSITEETMDSLKSVVRRIMN